MDTPSLTKFFITDTQAKLFAESLSRVSEKAYSTDFDLEQALTEQLGMAKKDLFLQLMKGQSVPLNSTSAIKKCIEDLLVAITSLPLLTLTIAIEPNEALLKSIVDWCELNIGSQVILKVETQPTLIAGSTVSFQGKYLDVSIKPVFDKLTSAEAPVAVQSS